MIQLTKNILELQTSYYYDTKKLLTNRKKIVITFMDILFWHNIKKQNWIQPKPAQQKPNPSQHC